jgi:hypothetical protein
MYLLRGIRTAKARSPATADGRQPSGSATGRSGPIFRDVTAWPGNLPMRKEGSGESHPPAAGAGTRSPPVDNAEPVEVRRRSWVRCVLWISSAWGRNGEWARGLVALPKFASVEASKQHMTRRRQRLATSLHLAKAAALHVRGEQHRPKNHSGTNRMIRKSGAGFPTGSRANSTNKADEAWPIGPGRMSAQAGALLHQSALGGQRFGHRRDSLTDRLVR